MHTQLPSLDPGKLFSLCRFSSARAGASSDLAGEVEIYGFLRASDASAPACVHASWRLDEHGGIHYERAVLRAGLAYDFVLAAEKAFAGLDMASLAVNAIEAARDRFRASRGFSDAELTALRGWHAEVLSREERGWTTHFEVRLTGRTVDGRRVVLGFAGRLFCGERFELDELVEGVPTLPPLSERHGPAAYARQLIRNLRHIWLPAVRAGVALV